MTYYDSTGEPLDEGRMSKRFVAPVLLFEQTAPNHPDKEIRESEPSINYMAIGHIAFGWESPIEIPKEGMKFSYAEFHEFCDAYEELFKAKYEEEYGKLGYAPDPIYTKEDYEEYFGQSKLWLY